MAAEVEGGADQPALVTARVAVVGEVISGDPAGHGADGFGGFGGVLGQVGRDRDVGGLAAAGSGMWTVRVSSWAPQRMSHPCGRAGWGTVANQVDAAAAVMAAASCSASRAGEASWPRLVGGVQAEDGVEVDQAAGLELGHLGVGELDFPGPGGLAARASWRRMAMVVRRHSSGACAFHTTAPW